MYILYRDMLTKYTIYGERCSGTTYLENIFKLNFNIDITWEYGWKHFFGFHDDKLKNSDDTLFVCIVRNLPDWINSFYREKWHLDLKDKKIPENEKLDKFLNKEFWSVEKNKEILYDRNIYTGERYKNIFELRHTKIKWMIEDLPKKVKNYIFIRHEDLINDFENTLLRIKDKGIKININFPLNTTNYKNTKKVFVKKKNSIPTESILSNINITPLYEIKLYNMEYMYINLLEVYFFPYKIRLGTNRDGGYVICKLEGGYDCYISCGVSNEASMDRDFLNLYKNIGKNNSFAFDGTITDYPWDFTKEITFIKKNISNFNDKAHTDLENLINIYDNIFLSMDIEGGEYEWLLSLTSDKLQKFKQICIEFHGLNDNSYGYLLRDKIKCLEKLNQTHYIMHAHGNNNSGIKNNIPDVLELTYINKKYILDTPFKNKTHFPIKGLDYPNNNLNSDYILNNYPFVEKNNIFNNSIKGTWFNSARNIQYIGKNNLICELKNKKGNWIKNNLTFVINDTYENIDGKFVKK